MRQGNSVTDDDTHCQESDTNVGSDVELTVEGEVVDVEEFDVGDDTEYEFLKNADENTDVIAPNTVTKKTYSGSMTIEFEEPEQYAEWREFFDRDGGTT